MQVACQMIGRIEEDPGEGLDAMEPIVSLLEERIREDQDFLRKPWEKVSGFLMTALHGKGFADVQLLGDAWACNAQQLLLEAQDGSSMERRYAWGQAAQEMRAAFLTEEDIQKALTMLASALGWSPEEQQELVDDAAPVQAATEELHEDVKRPELPVARVDKETVKQQEIASLEAFAALLQARREAGKKALHVPLHFLLCGGKESERSVFAQDVATRAQELGLLDRSDVWFSLAPPEERALWYLQAGEVPAGQLTNLADVLATDDFLAVLSGSEAEVEHLLHLCAPLRYVFPRRLVLAETEAAV